MYQKELDFLRHLWQTITSQKMFSFWRKQTMLPTCHKLGQLKLYGQFVKDDIPLDPKQPKIWIPSKGSGKKSQRKGPKRVVFVFFSRCGKHSAALIEKDRADRWDQKIKTLIYVLQNKHNLKIYRKLFTGKYSFISQFLYLKGK